MPPAPAAAATYLGDRLPLMERFAGHLADTGVSHGLVGPREVPRLWDRHVLNCAVVADLLPQGVRVADVGSGAGLPGLVLAIARPDITITLIEPLLRRVTWLDDVRDDLDLENVTIRRARAEQCDDVEVDIVTSRAVARLDTLSQWSLPLLTAGGRMLALKGSSAQEEVDEARTVLESMGADQIEVLRCGAGIVDPETVVVSVSIDGRVTRNGRRTKVSNGASHREGNRRRKQRRK
ncbi:16S rRNA (guanine(527)-N(7))-methyltransferase RsmG [Calidifontibacter terrae]